MTTARVVLVRHGIPVDRDRCHGCRADPDLAPAGHEQARAAAARLGFVGRVVTSPAARARATAAALASDAEIDPRWAERDFGAWEGHRWDQLWQQASPRVLTDGRAYAGFTPPGGEPIEAVAARVAAALHDLVADVDDRPTAVVTHAGPIRLAIAHTLGLPVAASFGFRPGYATSAWLTWWGTAWSLERLGW